MSRMSDDKAIQVALHIAIDTEISLIDAYSSAWDGTVSASEPAVKRARRNIASFKRVLRQRYGIEYADPAKKFGGKPVPINSVMNAAPREFGR